MAAIKIPTAMALDGSWSNVVIGGHEANVVFDGPVSNVVIGEHEADVVFAGPRPTCGHRGA